MTMVDAPFVLSVTGTMQIQMNAIQIVSNQGDASCSL